MTVEYVGACGRCKAAITAQLTVKSDGEATVDPVPLISVYCECGENPRRGLHGPWGVVLTRREVA